MFRRTRLFLVIALITMVSLSLYADTSQPSNGARNLTFSSVPDSITKTVGNPKIASDIKQVFSLMEKHPDVMKKFKGNFIDIGNDSRCTFGLKINDLQEIRVAIQLHELTDANLEILQKAGVKVLSTLPERNLVYSSLTREQIEKIAGLEEVNIIRLPEAMMTNIGSVTTEGDELLGTREVRDQFNYFGTNVKVGVISDGMAYTEDSVAKLDLPPYDGLTPPDPEVYYPTSNIIYFSFADPSDIYTGVQQGQEGTAMMEIIHDIAPNAQLYFCNFDFYNAPTFNMAKNWLASQGCDIICDDISVFNAGNLDGTSPYSLLNTQLVQAGHLYYTSVGNAAQNHYGGNFTDDSKNPNKIHNFVLDPSGGTSDETLEVRIAPLSMAAFYLTWYEPFGYSGDDIDMYLLDPDTLDLARPIAYSTDFQDGRDDPVEAFIVYNSGASVLTSLVFLRKHSDLTPRRMDCFILGGVELLQYITPAGSVACNSDAGGGVMSIGAIDVNKPGHAVVQPYSSNGPTLDGRIKPEMAAFDGCVTSVPDFEVFYGTSAAAPHAAAVAALLRELLPSESPNQINSYLRLYCDDLLPVGIDNKSGSGRMNAYVVFDKLINTGITNRYRSYTFNSTTEGWQHFAPSNFTSPIFSYEPGFLVMTSTNNINTFGYWYSPIVQFLPDNSKQLIADRMYEIRVRMKSSNTTATEFPAFRIRVLSNTYNEVAEKLFNSTAGNGVFPDEMGKYFYVHFMPDQDTIVNGVSIAIDLINFDAGDSPDAVYYIDDVQIQERTVGF